jgi:hypothetical protein
MFPLDPTRPRVMKPYHQQQQHALGVFPVWGEPSGEYQYAWPIFSGDVDDGEEEDEDNWEIGETRTVEFFQGINTKVTLLSTDAEHEIALKARLDALDGKTPLIMDLEWYAWGRGPKVISLYQFCASANEVLLVRDLGSEKSGLLTSFLERNAFVGKGCANDKINLRSRYGFVPKLDDLEDWLRCHQLPLNFEKMYLRFAGHPMGEFKDRSITMSDWDQDVLTDDQVLYAAFDAIAIFLSDQGMRKVDAKFWGSRRW